MRRVLIFLAGVLLFAGNAEAASWSSLWLTPDQRGEQLLQQGDAAAAARTYADPRRKAYAELRAGDYKAAAQGFEKFDDSDAHYNRGNALVHAGALQQALAAYDAALKRNPENHDAKHNRDLVAQALKKQQQQQKNKSGSGKGSPQSGTDKNQKSSGSGQQDSTDHKNSGQQQKPAGGKEAGQDQQNSQDEKDSQSASSSSQSGQSQQKDSAQSKDEAAQARKDAATGLKNQAAAQAAQQQNTPDHDASPSRHAAEGSSKPLTEQQISQEQWLRRIPDDPSGLLRRKFMIEHMMRQQNQQGQSP